LVRRSQSYEGKQIPGDSLVFDGQEAFWRNHWEIGCESWPATVLYSYSCIGGFHWRADSAGWHLSNVFVL
jgi:hypothetical protein